MTDTQRDVASFLIRFTQDLWRSPTGDPQIAWRGHIRHVQGETEETFTDFAEALKFIQDHLAQRVTPGVLRTTTPNGMDTCVAADFANCSLHRGPPHPRAVQKLCSMKTNFAKWKITHSDPF